MDAHIEVYSADGQPLSPRYSSTEQALRAEVERQKLVIAELVRALGDVTKDMFATEDSGDVLMYVAYAAAREPYVSLLTKQSANAFHRAEELITKHGSKQ